MGNITSEYQNINNFIDENNNNDNDNTNILSYDQLRQLRQNGIDIDIAFIPYQMKRLNIWNNRSNEIIERKKIVIKPSFHLQSIELKNHQIILNILSLYKLDLLLHYTFIAKDEEEDLLGLGQINFDVQQKVQCYDENKKSCYPINLPPGWLPEEDVLTTLIVKLEVLMEEEEIKDDVKIKQEISYINIKQLKIKKQIILYNNKKYELCELYGDDNQLNSSFIEGESAEAHDDDDDHANTCVICLTNLKVITCLPCRHLCICKECSELLSQNDNKCPLCRTVVESYLNLQGTFAQD